MGKLSYTVAQLNEAISKVFSGFADVSGVTAQASDVLAGKTFVGSNRALTTGTLTQQGSGFPIEISSEAEMNNVLSNATSSDVGKIYKYTGSTTSTYTSNQLYVISND